MVQVATVIHNSLRYSANTISNFARYLTAWRIKRCRCEEKARIGWLFLALSVTSGGRIECFQ